MAFHPNYATNGFFFVYFTDNSSDNEVYRYKASPPSSNSVDPATGQSVLKIPHPNETIHNGGQLQFGKDGDLYISTGDGGPQGDPNNNAQDLAKILGKILRIG